MVELILINLAVTLLTIAAVIRLSIFLVDREMKRNKNGLDRISKL